MQAWPSPDLPRLPGRGLPLRVRDTATGLLRPTAPGPVASLYVCGITPYDATHVGHAATYLAFDLLQRVWVDGGHDVRYVQNVTDVDDPLLARAAEHGDDWEELAARETEVFRHDMAALRVLPPDHYVGAVEAIPVIVELVETLRDKGAAYEVDGDLYFSVASDPRFGSVAHLPTETMLTLSAERGGDPQRPGKKDPLDCLLWQAARPGEPSWPSPFGPGRPGWHVECTAIALHDLGGPTIDVQGGGSDLAFPHHELGASEAVVATGSWPFARAFVHAGMVGYQGEKMSKSLGNLVFVRDLRREHDPAAVRLAVLAHHYRSDWEWAAADLADAEERLHRWRAATGQATGPGAEGVLADVRRLLADDLRAPDALAAVDRWAHAALTRGGDDPSAPGLVRDLVDALLGVALWTSPPSPQ